MLNLSRDRNIIIKEADKGGATVRMDSSYCREKIENMLQDKNYYIQLEANPKKKILSSYKI